MSTYLEKLPLEIYEKIFHQIDYIHMDKYGGIFGDDCIKNKLALFQVRPIDTKKFLLTLSDDSFINNPNFMNPH